MNYEFINFKMPDGTFAVINLNHVVNMNYYKDGHPGTFGTISFLEIILITRCSYLIDNKELALKIFEHFENYSEKID